MGECMKYGEVFTGLHAVVTGTWLAVDGGMQGLRIPK